MARRKLNTKFLLVLGGVGVGILGVGGAYMVAYPQLLSVYHSVTGQSIETLVKAGDDAAAAGDYEKAAENYGRAAGRSRADTALQIKYVDAVDYTVQGDVEKFRRLHDLYMTIRQTDTSNVPALERVMRLQLPRLLAAPNDRANVSTLKQTADRILQLQPDHRDAKKARAMATLEPALRGGEVPAEEMAEQRKAAEELFKADPKDGQVLFLVLRARMFDVDEARRSKDDAATATALKACDDLIAEALAADPESGEAHFARWQLLRVRAIGTDTKKTEEVARVVGEMNKALEQADALAKPDAGGDDNLFLTIRSLYLRDLESRDPKKAEDRYRTLVEELPNNRQPRLMLVNFLARMPGRLGDAQKVLETPWKPAKPLRAWESMQQKQIEFVEQARLNLVRLAALEAVTEPAERKKQIEIVEAAYKQMASVPDIVNTIPVWLLRVEAGLALARDDINGGIVKLDSALSRVPAEGGDVDTRVEILQDLSQAYVKINQTGSARPLLQELVQRRPANVQARVRYADVLITEQRYDEAKEQLDVLRRGLPDNVVVERMYVRLLGLRPAGLREQYARYPEETREQRVIKLTAAGGLGDTPEILRLSKLMLEADPGDVDAAVIHVQARAREDRAAAAAVLETALKAKPDDKRLAALRDALAAETPEAQAELLRANVEKIADPYEKEIARAELARRAGKPDEAVALLRKAQAIKPDEQRAYEIEFNLLIAQSKFDEAAQAVDALGRVNADQTFGELTRARLSVAKAAALTTEDERKKAQLAALEEATVVTQKYPQIAAATLLRAQLLQQLNRLDEAITQYTAVLTRTPTNVEALRGSIQSLLVLDRRAEAKKQIDEAIRIAPNDPALRRLELVYNINFGDMPRAIAALEDDLKQRPTDPQAWGQLGEVYTTAATLRGGKNDPAGEKDLLQKAADLYAKAVPLFPEDLRFAGLYAGVQRRLGNADEAEKVFKQLTETNAWKDRHEAHQLLADQYTRSNKLDLAQSVLVDILNRFDPPPTQPLIALSQVYVRLNRVNDALAVLERKKSDPAVARQRIELLLVNNQLDAARAAIEEALAGKPTPELYVTAAVVELRNNQIDKADGFIAAALRDRPGDAAALYYRAQIRLSRTPPQTSEAIADLTQVVQLSPGNAEARITLANQFLLRRERDKAIEQLQAGWDANRSSKPIFLPLVSQLLETGRAKEAERVVGQAKESPALAADQDVILAEANVALATGNNNKAVETAKKAYAVAPSNAALRDRYYDLLLRAKSYRDVLRDSDAVVKADPSLWTVHRQRGIAMRRLADPAADKEFALAFDGALKARNLNGVRLVTGTVAEELGAKAAATLLEPVIGSDVALRMILAETYQKSGDAPAAVAQYERSLEDRSRLSPDQVKTLLAAVGGAYLQLSPQAVDKARRAYEELLTYTPDDLMLLNNLAFVLTLPGSGGNPADALKYSEKAYALSKAQPPSDQMYYIWDTHGWALVQNNRRDEGVSVLREAAANARFPDVHLHLAEALLAGNDTDNAELALEKARRAIEEAEAAKGHVDAGWRPKYEQLSLDLAAKRKNALGAAN